VASDQIEVNADPDVVWDVISSIEAWPSWNPAIKAASLNGPLDEGTAFQWKAGTGTISSVLRQVERPRPGVDRPDARHQSGTRLRAGQHPCPRIVPHLSHASPKSALP